MGGEASPVLVGERERDSQPWKMVLKSSKYQLYALVGPLRTGTYMIMSRKAEDRAEPEILSRAN